ncbi:MAG: DinB family protein [Tepidiformaceae bacterium]
MDRASIEQLYDHLDFAWRQIVDVIGGAEEDLFTRPAPGSGWPTLRDCLGHIIFGYDRWLSIMANREPTGIAESAISLAAIDSARLACRTEVKALLERLGDSGLQEMRAFSIDDEAMPYTFGELLAHLALHERGHHGDVTTLFYQLGISEEMALEYRFHLARNLI